MEGTIDSMCKRSMDSSQADSIPGRSDGAAKFETSRRKVWIVHHYRSRSHGTELILGSHMPSASTTTATLVSFSRSAMAIFSGPQGLLLQQSPQLEDELSSRGGVVLWQVEPPRGPCGTVRVNSTRSD